MALTARVEKGRRRRGAEIELYEDGERITTLKGGGGGLKFWKGTLIPFTMGFAAKSSISTADGIEKTDGDLDLEIVSGSQNNPGKLILPEGWYLGNVTARALAAGEPGEFTILLSLGGSRVSNWFSADRKTGQQSFTVGPFAIIDDGQVEVIATIDNDGNAPIELQADITLTKIG